MLLQGPQNILERKKQLKQYHIKKLYATAFLLGLIHSAFLIHELYIAATDPYVLPWGNTTENLWFYSSPAAYVTAFLACLAGYIPGLVLMLIGQLKEKIKFTIIGAIIIGFVFIVIAASITIDTVSNGKTWP
jgi:hypothetical protein